MVEKNVFISALGQTPQVLTEALYGFWIKRKIPIHSIEIITTPSGKELLKEKGFLDLKRGPFRRLYEDYGLRNKKYDFPDFDESHIHVPPGAKKRDLSDSNENALMEVEVTKHLRRLTQDPETRVLASLAGGRKTMSAYMILGMTVFARTQDELFHVLLDSPNGKTSEGWWYPHPRKPMEKKWVNLFEVPFPRLRQIIQTSMPNLLYRSMTEAFFQFNQRVDEPNFEINLQSPERFFKIDGRPLKAEPKQMMWLALLAERKSRYFKDGKCPPKIKWCQDCQEKPCALRPVGQVQTHYNLDNEDSGFLERIFNVLKNEKADQEDTKKFDGILDWAPIASRLRKNIQAQFPEYFGFLDSLGGEKGPGAKARRHVLGLDRLKINIKE